jgi:hypothetical protein
MDPLTITACISGATRAYNLVAKAVNAGREIEDTAQYIGKFFDSKEKILEIEMETQLREIIVLYGPGEAFYNEMMKTRRTIRAKRLAEAEARAINRRLLIDGGLIMLMAVVTVGAIYGMIRLVTR